MKKKKIVDQQQTNTICNSVDTLDIFIKKERKRETRLHSTFKNTKHNENKK